MLQVSLGGVDEMGMLVLLSIGGMGMFLLVIVLAFLATKLVTRDNGEEDREGIMRAYEENDFNEHFDSLDDERAIFIIDESSKLSTPNIVNEKILSGTNEQSGESDRNEVNFENKSSVIRRVLNTFNILRFVNRRVEVP